MNEERIGAGPGRTLRNAILIMACLGLGRFKDTLNRCIQHGVELGIGLLG